MGTSSEIKTPAWARAYARRATSFATVMAPRIRALYEATCGDGADRSVLDVCCGTGTLAGHFLEQGYRVTGVDLSEPMLAIANRGATEKAAGQNALFSETQTETVRTRAAPWPESERLRREFDAVGTDEIQLIPTSSDLSQLQRVVDAVGDI